MAIEDDEIKRKKEEAARMVSGADDGGAGVDVASMGKAVGQATTNAVDAVRGNNVGANDGNTGNGGANGAEAVDAYGNTAEDYDSGAWLAHLRQRQAAYEPLSADELKRIRKRQRATETIGALADAANSVTNLVGTTQGAPDWFDPNNTLSKAAQERNDRAKALRDADEQRWLAYAQQERDHILKQRQQARADREQMRKELLDEWKQEHDQLKLEWQIAYQSGNQELAKAKAEEMKRHNEEREAIMRNDSKIRQYNAESNRIRAAKAGNGGSRGSGKVWTLDYGDKTVDYASKEAYEQAVIDAAIAEGIPVTRQEFTRPGVPATQKDEKINKLAGTMLNARRERLAKEGESEGWGASLNRSKRNGGAKKKANDASVLD